MSAARTTLTLIHEWEGPDRNNGKWPYPTKYKKYLVQGELAERARRALDAGIEYGITLTEEVESGGYSEYTQENYYSFVIAAGPDQRHFRPENYYGSGNLLSELLRWLEDAEVSA